MQPAGSGPRTPRALPPHPDSDFRPLLELSAPGHWLLVRHWKITNLTKIVPWEHSARGLLPGYTLEVCNSTWFALKKKKKKLTSIKDLITSFHHFSLTVQVRHLVDSSRFGLIKSLCENFRAERPVLGREVGPREGEQSVQRRGAVGARLHRGLRGPDARLPSSQALCLVRTGHFD